MQLLVLGELAQTQAPAPHVAGTRFHRSVGKMVFRFLGAIAEFERSLIQERTRSGLARARAAGIHGGRPRKGLDIGEALQLHAEGWGVRRIIAIIKPAGPTSSAAPTAQAPARYLS